MHPKTHILAGLFLVGLIYFLYPSINLFSLFIIFSSSVLIDVDHYFYHIFREKKWNLLKCYNWYKKNLQKTLNLPMSERKKIYSGFYLFHGIEWLIVLFLWGIYVCPILIFVFIGFLFHMLLDIPHEYFIKRTLHKISLVWNYIQWKKLGK